MQKDPNWHVEELWHILIKLVFALHISTITHYHIVCFAK
jgi:hypothetical protein